MGITKEEYETFCKTRMLPDDDLFGESLDLSKVEDNYVWSIYGQCWLPK